MSPLAGTADAGTSGVLRRDTPSACSSRTVVASVNGRRPPSTFSSVERLSLASSAQRLPGDPATGDLLTNGIRELPALLGGKLLVRRRHRHPCWTDLGTLPDAQPITNPHKAVLAVTAPAGGRL